MKKGVWKTIWLYTFTHSYTMSAGCADSSLLFFWPCTFQNLQTLSLRLGLVTILTDTSWTKVSHSYKELHVFNLLLATFFFDFPRFAILLMCNLSLSHFQPKIVSKFLLFTSPLNINVISKLISIKCTQCMLFTFLLSIKPIFPLCAVHINYLC
jgi:hypothetical protein